VVKRKRRKRRSVRKVSTRCQDCPVHDVCPKEKQKFGCTRGEHAYRIKKLIDKVKERKRMEK